MSRSTSEYIVENAPIIVTVIIMLALMSDFFIVGGVPLAKEVMNAFVRAIPWASFITFILLLRAMYVDMQRRERWWWHNIFFFAAIIVSMIAYPLYTPVFNQIYYVFATGGIGAISSLSAFAFIAGTMSTFTMRSRMNIFLTICIVIGVLPFTPYIDILGKAVFDFATWSMTTLMAGSAAGQTYIRNIAALAIAVRALLLIEKFKPKMR